MDRNMNNEASESCEDTVTESTITVPKAPDKDCMKMLIRANQFIEHAKLHAHSGQEFDLMIAIHNLDNAIEYILRILIIHYDVENVEDRIINTSELMGLFGELNKFFEKHNMPILPYGQQIRLIRDQRNAVQHGLILPSNDIRSLMTYGERFMKKVLLNYFGLTRHELAYSTLVKDERTKEFLHNAEEDIKNKKYLEAIVYCRDAFDYEKFFHVHTYQQNFINAPGKYALERFDSDVAEWISSLNESVMLSTGSVDMAKYFQYEDYLKYIPSEYWKDPHYSASIRRGEWKKEDADFCYDFVANTILNWETQEVQYLYKKDLQWDGTISELASKIHVKNTIEGIDIREVYEDHSCMYALKNKEAKLFYVDSFENEEKLKTVANKGFAWSFFKRYIGDNLNQSSKQLIKIFGMDSHIVMNNPETWEIYISYQTIPFTNQIIYDAVQAINGDETINLDEDIDKLACKNDIQPMLPLNSYEDAVKLYQYCTEKEIDSNGWYSSNLIEKVSGESIKK